MLRPDEVRHELEQQLRCSPELIRRQFHAGRIWLVLSDGSRVAKGDEPGTLVIEDHRVYSAAWL